MLVSLTHELVLLQALFPFTFDDIRHHHFPPHLIFYHDVLFDHLCSPKDNLQNQGYAI